MKKNLFIAALGLVVLAGCSSEDEVSTLIANSDNAINFTTYVGKQTKAIDKGSFVENDAIGVFAYYTGSKGFDTTAAPNFMYEQAITKDSKAWSYSPLKYWPNTSGEKITFFGYYPSAKTGMTFYKAGTTTAYENKATGFPDIQFTVQDTAANQVDLMYSSLIDQTKPENGKVLFSFTHALSKVNIKAKMSSELDAATTVTIKNVSLSNIYNTNTLKYATSKWSWDTATTLKDYSTKVSIDLTKDSGSTAVDITKEATGFLMVPQTLSKDADKKATLTISYDVTTVDTSLAQSSTISNTVSVDISGLSTKTWEMNQQYTYTIQIALTGVTVDASASEWGTPVVEQ